MFLKMRELFYILGGRSENVYRKFLTARFPSEYFIRLVHVFQRFLSFVVSMSIDSQIAPATLILADLCISK